MRIFLVLFFISNLSAQDIGVKNYYHEYEVYSDDDYRVQRDKLLCYSCIYTVEGGATQGSASCADPFIYEPSAINHVTCSNGSCAKIYLKLENKYSLVHRSCVFNCIDRQTPLATTECCSSDFCNGSPGILSDRTPFFLILIVNIVFLVMRHDGY